MKICILLLISLIGSISSAISWKVYGACSNSPVHEGQLQIDLQKNTGEISLEIFKTNNIPFVGAKEGFNSILDTPVGLDAIEVVSNNEMRVYGWCYSVNGKDPLSMPDQVTFTTQDDELIWYFAYSTNLQGQWTDYCSPAYWIKAIQFCGR